MATISKVLSDTSSIGWDLYLWEGMGNADQGTVLPLKDRHPGELIVQAVGTWGGATLTIQGSLDNSNFDLNINDLDGTAISMTADAVASMREAPLYIRPNTAGGSGTDIDVYILVRELPDK